MATSVSTTKPTDRGGEGDQFELLEEGGSRASHAISDDDELEGELRKLATQETAYDTYTSTRSEWYKRVRHMLLFRPWRHSMHRTAIPNWFENTAERRVLRFGGESKEHHPKLVYGLLLGLTVALAVQSIRLSATNNHPSIDRPVITYGSDGSPITLEDMYPASLVLRRPPPPLDDLTISVNVTPNAHEPAWRLSDDASRLPKCERFVLTSFWVMGMGANLNIMVRRCPLKAVTPIKCSWKQGGDQRGGGCVRLQFRAAMIAEKLGAVLLVDNNNWPYGRLEYYLEPYTINCVPPDDWYEENLATAVGDEGWKLASRLKASIPQVGALDGIDQEFFLDAKKAELQRVHDLMEARNPKPSVLPPSDTLPPPLIPAFEEYARILHSLWKPVPEILEDVARVKTMMGIGGDRPTIAVQVRLGDKASEYEHGAMFTENTFGNLTAHLEVMHALYDRMVGCPSSQAKPCYPLSPTARRFSINKQPRAILFTIEDDALEHMARNAIAAPFEFDRSPAVNLASHFTFLQESFDSLPLKARVASARALVRDIILAAKETDATVLTMSSNLGRLVALFAGSEAVLGPPTPELRYAGGRIRALDTPWFPTVWPDGIWSGLGQKTG